MTIVILLLILSFAMQWYGNRQDKKKKLQQKNERIMERQGIKYVYDDTTIKKCDFLGISRGNFILRKDGKVFYKKPRYCFDSELEAWDFLIETLNAAIEFGEKRIQEIIDKKAIDLNNNK